MSRFNLYKPMAEAEAKPTEKDTTRVRNMCRGVVVVVSKRGGFYVFFVALSCWACVLFFVVKSSQKCVRKWCVDPTSILRIEKWVLGLRRSLFLSLPIVCYYIHDLLHDLMLSTLFLLRVLFFNLRTEQRCSIVRR